MTWDAEAGCTSRCLLCDALSPHTLVVVGATHPESLVAATEKEPPPLAERVSRSFVLLWRRHSALGSAQQVCACTTLGGHHCPLVTGTDQAGRTAPTQGLYWENSDQRNLLPFPSVRESLQFALS